MVMGDNPGRAKKVATNYVKRENPGAGVVFMTIHAYTKRNCADISKGAERHDFATVSRPQKRVVKHHKTTTHKKGRSPPPKKHYKSTRKPDETTAKKKKSGSLVKTIHNIFKI